MTARDVLAEIEQRANAATPGPWIAVDDNEGTDYFPLWAVANDEFYNPSGGDEDMWQAIHACLDTGLQSDAEFIAHARTDVPKLVAALRAVLDLHRPMTKSEADILDLDAGDCFDCWQETPCDTVRSITDALNGVTAAGSDRSRP